MCVDCDSFVSIVSFGVAIAGCAERVVEVVPFRRESLGRSLLETCTGACDLGQRSSAARLVGIFQDGDEALPLQVFRCLDATEFDESGEEIDVGDG